MALPDIPQDDWNAYQAAKFKQATDAAITGLTTSYGTQLDTLRARVAPENRVWVDRAVAAAKKYNVDPLIYAKQIYQESGFSPTAGSNEGARGIAQFTDPTAKAFGINAWNPDQSLDAGARYMRQNLNATGGDYRLALASYNAGGGNVAKYGQNIFNPAYLKSQGWSDQDANQPASYIKAILGDQTPAVAPVQPTNAPMAAAPTPNPNDAWNQQQRQAFNQAVQSGPDTSAWATVQVPPTTTQPSFRDHAQAKIDALGGADATQYPADAGQTAGGMASPFDQAQLTPRMGAPGDTAALSGSPSPNAFGGSNIPGVTSGVGGATTGADLPPQPPSDNENLKDFAAYASSRIASLTSPQPYNDMAGAASRPAAAFGSNPEDVTSPIEQARAAVSSPAAPLTPLTATANPAGMAYTGALTPAKLPAYQGPAPTPYNDMAGAGGIPDPGIAGPDTPLGRLLAIPGQAQQAVSAAVMPDLSHPNETPQQRTQRYWNEHTDPNATPTDRLKQLLAYATSIEDTQVANVVQQNPNAAFIGPAFKLATNPFTYLGNSPTMIKAGLAGAAIGGGIEAAKPSSSLSDIATQAIAGYGQGQLIGGLGEGAYALGKAAAPTVGKAARAAAPTVRRLTTDESGMIGYRPLDPVPSLGANGEIQPAMPQTRMFHGTNSTFRAPDPNTFQDSGLYGPGYYLTSEPRIAQAYSKVGQMTGPLSFLPNTNSLQVSHLKSEIASFQHLIATGARGYPPGQLEYWRDVTLPQLQEKLTEAQSHGPQIRAVNVPNDLNLFDVRQDADPDLVSRLQDQLDKSDPGTGSDFVGHLLSEAKAADNQSIYDALVSSLNGDKAAANDELMQQGFDGIAHTGGLLTPIRGDGGAPITHEVNVIFPSSMGKLTNAISGTKFGSPPAVGGAIVGGLAGAQQGDTPEERARNALLGAAAGGVGGHLLGSGQLGRLAREDAGTVNLGGILDAGKSTAKAVNELIAPAKNTPPQVQQALKDFANRNLEGAVQAETIGLRAKKILGPLDNADTAGFFESTSQLHPSQTPEQAAFAREVHDYMEATKVEGKAHGYIQGDVVNGPNAQVSSYFPHIYQENLTRATAQARKGGLNPNDFYSNSRTFPTLSDAQAAGFNPVDSFSGPLQHYVGRVASSEAKYQLVESLKNAGPPAAIPYTAGVRLPDGWVAGSSTVPQFAKYAFPEPVAKAINNIVGTSDMRSTMIGRGFLNAQSLGKELLFTLSGFHNVTELRQAISANGFKGVPIVARTLESGFVPGAFDVLRLKEANGWALAARSGVTGLAGSERALDIGGQGLSPVAAMAVRSGAGAVTGAASGYGIGAASGSDDQTKLRLALIGAVGGAAAGPLMKPIANALWERQVPTLKYLTWKNQVALGRDPEAAARFVNNTFGGQNLAAIARGKTFQDVTRTLLLAPDWWESWLRQVGNVAAKGDTGAMARQYWARTAITSAFTLEGLNYAFNHHFTDQNDPDHANQVEVTGLYKMLGLDRRDPKTGAPIREYMAVLPAPVESLLNLATGGPQGAARFAMGRISTPVRAGLQTLTNTNYRGQQIVPQYTPPLEAAKLYGANLLSQVAPIGVQQAETSSAGGEPASLAAFATATGLRTSAAAKSTYAGPQVSQRAYDLLSQNGVGDWHPFPIGDSIDGFGLTRDERTRYQTLVDQGRENAIVKLSQKAAWLKMSAADKKQLLDDVMRGVNDSAATQVLRSIPKEELKKRQQIATAAAH